MAHSTLPITTQAETDRSTALSLLVSLRPAQWTKNLFVFGALSEEQRAEHEQVLGPLRRPQRHEEAEYSRPIGLSLVRDG